MVGTTGELKVGLVDDEPLWLDLMTIALDQAGFEIRAAFSNPLQAIQEWPTDIDVAIVDVDLGNPAMQGFELARQLRRTKPELGVVFLTSVEDPWIVADAAPSAMAGTSYLLKRTVSGVEQLRHAILTAAEGGVVVDVEVLATIRDNGPMRGLTPLQARILRLMAAGATNAQLAQELGLAVKTVEGNITKIARVLGVPDSENLRVGCVTRYLSAAVRRAQVSLPGHPH